MIWGPNPIFGSTPIYYTSLRIYPSKKSHESIVFASHQASLTTPAKVPEMLAERSTRNGGECSSTVPTS